MTVGSAPSFQWLAHSPEMPVQVAAGDTHCICT